MLRRGLLGLAILALGGALLQADDIILKGKEKEKPLKGKVAKEGPKEIALAGAKDTIPSETIAEIVYELTSPGAALEYGAGVKAEQASHDPVKEKDRSANLKEAIKRYEAA